jgi:hypothetical protein
MEYISQDLPAAVNYIKGYTGARKVRTGFGFLRIQRFAIKSKYSV